MPTPSPVEDPQAWSFLWLGGEMFPAACEITGSTQWDLDVKKTKGQDGVGIKDNGTTPAKLSATLTFVPKFWAKVQEILDRVSPPQLGGKRRPVEIKNARTDARGIHSVYITEIGLPQTDDHGMMSFTMSLLQWIPEPKATKAGTGGKKTPKSAVERDPFKPGSYVQPIFAPVGTSLSSGHGSQEDEDWARFMNGTMSDHPDGSDDSFNFKDFNPKPPPDNSELAKALEKSGAKSRQ